MKSLVPLAVSVALLAASCKAPAPADPMPSALVGTTSTPRGAASADQQARRARILAALDAGNLARAHEELQALLEDSPEAPGTRALLAAVRALRGDDRAELDAVRATLLANVKPVRVGPLPQPPPARVSALALGGTRRMGPSGAQLEADAGLRGRFFTSGRGTTLESSPGFLPARVGDIPLRFLRWSDDRWLAVYGERFVLIVAADGRLHTLLDFGPWQGSARSTSFAVEWAELSGDTLYVTASGSTEKCLVAVDAKTGAVRWRTVVAAFTDSFVVGKDQIIGWSYARSASGSGQLLSIDRATGSLTAQRATPEIGSGDARVRAGDGVVYAYASSSTPNPKHLQHDERIEIPMAAATPRPAPPEPTAAAPRGPLADYVVDSKPDARLLPWSALDDSADPQRAVVLLAPLLETHGTNLATLSLGEASRVALAAARERAGAQLSSRAPVVAMDGPPAGRAPIPRPRPRKLVVIEQRPSSFSTLGEEFPAVREMETVAPAWMPDTLGTRGRDEEATRIVYAASPAETRVAVYKGSYQGSIVAGWTSGKLRFLVEVAGDVRYADVAGDVLLMVRLRGSAFVLEARDTKTGALFYSVPNVHDQSFVLVDGYILASASVGSGTRERVDVVLIEADTGRVVDSTKRTTPQDLFYVFLDPKGAIRAVNTVSALTLELR